MRFSELAIFPGRLSRQAQRSCDAQTNTKRADSLFIVMTAVNIWTPYYFVDWSALIVEISWSLWRACVVYIWLTTVSDNVNSAS